MDSCISLCNNGVAALRFDFSGNGQSEGDFAETTYSKHVTEMRTAVDWMRQNGFERIGLAGHSMGAAIALLTAASTPEIQAVCTLAGRYSHLSVNGVLDDSKAKTLEQTGRIGFVSRNRSLSLKSDFFEDVAAHDLLEKVTNLRQPVLAIHGDMDDIIPVEEVYKSQELKPEKTEIFVVENADHMFSNKEHRNLITQRLTNWFKNQMSL